jgi:hypothetical protein
LGEFEEDGVFLEGRGGGRERGEEAGDAVAPGGFEDELLEEGAEGAGEASEW